MREKSLFLNHKELCLRSVKCSLPYGRILVDCYRITEEDVAKYLSEKDPPAPLSSQ